MEIVLQELTKVYNRRIKALSGVNLSIQPGMYGLLGPNGAGKTTLMRILAGILRPTTGQVCVGGHDLTTAGGRTALKRQLGYLPQELGIYPDLTAHEFLDYVGILKGLGNIQERHRQVNEALTTVGLAEVADRKLGGFSGGMKRRVGIAQALVGNPRLIIVDEPTSGLDPEERVRFRNLLSDLAGNRTVLLSTHIIEDIAQTCTYLAVLVGGQVVFQGTVSELLEQAKGYVWKVTTDNAKPDGDFMIVSTLPQGSSRQYRVVGDVPSDVQAEAVAPSLEDAYVWLMYRTTSRS